MKVVTQISVDCPYTNRGQYAEMVACRTLLGDAYDPTAKADNKSFDKDSDISSLRISVKSARFSLASKLYGETLAEMVADYFNRTHSTSWAYVATDGNIYIMNKAEFAEFLALFTTLQRASSKNGGGMVVRMRSESKAVLKWLAEH